MIGIGCDVNHPAVLPRLMVFLPSLMGTKPMEVIFEELGDIEIGRPLDWGSTEEQSRMIRRNIGRKNKFILLRLRIKWLTDHWWTIKCEEKDKGTLVFIAKLFLVMWVRPPLQFLMDSIAHSNSRAVYNEVVVEKEYSDLESWLTWQGLFLQCLLICYHQYSLSKISYMDYTQMSVIKQDNQRMVFDSHWRDRRLLFLDNHDRKEVSDVWRAESGFPCISLNEGLSSTVISMSIKCWKGTKVSIHCLTDPNWCCLGSVIFGHFKVSILVYIGNKSSGV